MIEERLASWVEKIFFVAVGGPGRRNGEDTTDSDNHDNTVIIA